MDLYKAIRELVEEKKRIDRIIASLEAMLKKGTTNTTAVGKVTANAAGVKRRGRKSMSAEERRLVSERMARYWAAKRGEKEPTAEATDDESNAAGSIS